MRYDEIGNPIPETDEDRSFLAKQEAAKAMADDLGDIVVTTNEGDETFAPAEAAQTFAPAPVDFPAVASDAVPEVNPDHLAPHKWTPERFDAWVSEVNRRIGIA